MEHNAKNRITYAAAYALLKKYAEQNNMASKTFEKLNRIMAEFYKCDPIAKPKSEDA